MKLHVISQIILFILTVIYGMFGLVLFGLSTWIIADQYQGTYISTLRLTEVRTGACLLLTTGIFLICISLIGCFAVARKNPRLMAAYLGCIIVTLIIALAGSIFVLARTKSIQRVVDDQIDRMVREYDNRGQQQGEAERFMDLIQTHLFCCGGESANDYHIRGIPLSCTRPWQSGVSQVWGCKEVAKRWLKYNLDAIAGIGLFVVVLLIVGAVAAGILLCSYASQEYSQVQVRGRKT